MGGYDFSKIITALVSLVAVWISYLAFRRASRKDNEDKIYQWKSEAYKELIYETGKFIDNIFNLMESMQECKNEQEWHAYLKENIPYSEAYDLHNLLFKHITVLPDDIIAKYNDLSNLIKGHLTNHWHFDTAIVADSYDRITDLHSELVNLAREDLQIDKLNKKLNYRLR